LTSLKYGHVIYIERQIYPGETLNHPDSSRTSSLGNGWQILGDLELPVGAGTEQVIDAWLAEVLGPLHLPVDFLDKILVSTREAWYRLLGTGILQKLGHIHLIVWVPSDRSFQKGQNWGFFRIEKVDDPTQDGETAGHSVELYLYLEG
jgi:hypothetical protein